jgi:hypothetical protein
MSSAKAYILEKKPLFRQADRMPAVARLIMPAGARLKTFQDAAALARLLQFTRGRTDVPLRVADLGGSNSPLPELLAKADPRVLCTFPGFAAPALSMAGDLPPPSSSPNLLSALLAESDGVHDAVVSVGVAEHVAPESLTSFFANTIRICRPGGLVLHLIYLNLSDSPLNPRGDAILAAANAALGASLLSVPDWAFSAGHVSGPDDAMFRLGRRDGNLAFRATHQAACLVIEIEKDAA